jgi:hypothetical protein
MARKLGTQISISTDSSQSCTGMGEGPLEELPFKSVKLWHIWNAVRYVPRTCEVFTHAISFKPQPCKAIIPLYWGKNGNSGERHHLPEISSSVSFSLKAHGLLQVWVSGSRCGDKLGCKMFIKDQLQWKEGEEKRLSKDLIASWLSLSQYGRQPRVQIAHQGCARLGGNTQTFTSLPCSVTRGELPQEECALCNWSQLWGVAPHWSLLLTALSRQVHVLPWRETRWLISASPAVHLWHPIGYFLLEIHRDFLAGF